MQVLDLKYEIGGKNSKFVNSIFHQAVTLKILFIFPNNNKFLNFSLRSQETINFITKLNLL